MIYTENYKLSDDIRVQCSELFSELGGIVVAESAYPQPFGNAWVQVQVGQLIFRFVWDRGIPFVQGKPSSAVASWRDIDRAIGAFAESQAAAHFKPPDNWREWCAFIKTSYQPIVQAFAE